MKKLLFLLGTILAISACTTSRNDAGQVSHEYDERYDDMYDRFIDNVFIKEKGRYSITYEYRDARIDDIAVMAARYCDETYATSAHLQSITLHKNNSRLATFHCYDLRD